MSTDPHNNGLYLPDPSDQPLFTPMNDNENDVGLNEPGWSNYSPAQVVYNGGYYQPQDACGLTDFQAYQHQTQHALQNPYLYGCTPNISSNASINEQQWATTTQYSFEGSQNFDDGNVLSDDGVGTWLAEHLQSGTLPLDTSLNRIPPPQVQLEFHNSSGQNSPVPLDSQYANTSPQHYRHVSSTDVDPRYLSPLRIPRSEASPESSGHTELNHGLPTPTDMSPSSGTSSPIPRATTGHDLARVATQILHGVGAPRSSSGYMSSSPRIAKPKAVHRLRPPLSQKAYQGKFAIEGSKARQQYGPVRRKEVKDTRDRGACIICAMHKKTCRLASRSTDLPEVDDTGVHKHEPCQQCATSSAKNNVNSLHLCFKVHVQEISVYRLQSPLHDHPLAPKSPIHWVTESTTPLEIRLTGRLESDPIKLDTRHFKPRKEDIVVRWFGASKPIEIPPYAAINLDEYKRALTPMLRPLGKVFLRGMIDRGCSETVARTLDMAFEFAAKHPSSTVDLALDVWVGSKLCATEKTIVGKEKLGMDAVHEEGALMDIIPVPPKIDNQTDTAAIEIMSDKATQLMEKLKKILIQPGRQKWYEVFLTSFVMINNIEFVMNEQANFLAHWRNVTEAPIEQARCISASELFIKEWEWSAEKLLHLWRTYCRTHFPFTKRTMNPAIEKGQLDAGESAFVRSMADRQSRGLIAAESTEVVNAHGSQYEMKWGAQLFAPPGSKKKPT